MKTNENHEEDPRPSAYVLNELGAQERQAFEAELEHSPALRAEVDQLRELADMLQAELGSEALTLSDAQRTAIVDRARNQPNEVGVQRWLRRLSWVGAASVAAAAGTLLYTGLRENGVHRTPERGRQEIVANLLDVKEEPVREGPGLRTQPETRTESVLDPASPVSTAPAPGGPGTAPGADQLSLGAVFTAEHWDLTGAEGGSTPPAEEWEPANTPQDELRALGSAPSAAFIAPIAGPGPASPGPPSSGTQYHGPGDAPPPSDGRQGDNSSFFVGRGVKERKVIGIGGGNGLPGAKYGGRTSWDQAIRKALTDRGSGALQLEGLQDLSREAYAHIVENDFVRVADDPRSTFSIDVDTASYANLRRFLHEGRLPPADAVRIEEWINYFSYDYPAPEGADPFAVHLEVASAPWKPEHMLLRVGLKGRDITDLPRRTRNLTFLLDVSGSMQPANKLPLLKRAMRLLVDQLTPEDRVAIVVYAGSSGLVLPATSCSEKPAILAALERLSSGGSTAGAAGIELAYRTAQENFIEGGINRVILATDGDFNVGISDEGSLVRLIEEKRDAGVFLSVLGFGTGNLQDSKMEKLADHGNGNYAYIDTLKEAHKVLVRELGGTLETIAKDVKIQIEFNPAEISGFRLIGYENRVLAHADFNDDAKDAGDIGAGHTVTALYELIPATLPGPRPPLDPLKYQESEREVSNVAFTGELVNVKLRYKEPQGSVSKLIERPVRKSTTGFEEASEDFRFAACVAAFGMLMRDSAHCPDTTIEDVMAMASAAAGADPFGYRSDFLGLLDLADRLKSPR
jgi:Ca-activated chloride channel family protein